MSISGEDNDIFRGHGVEVKFKNEQDFLKIKETLTRIGIASKKTDSSTKLKSDVLIQSCHVLHKRGRYAILHFKELFALDGKPTVYTEDDNARRNTIVKLLEEWGLLEIIDSKQIEKSVAPLSSIRILSFKEKENWELVAKYTLGKKKAK